MSSTTTTTSTIDRRYLNNKTKQDVIEITMLILDRETRLMKKLEQLATEWCVGSSTPEGQASTDCSYALQDLIEDYNEGRI